MKPIHGMKVFQITEVEWYAGPSVEACVDSYEADTGIDREEFLDEGEPTELSDEEMELFLHHGDDGSELPKTFLEELERLIQSGEQFPCLFATTEW